MSNIRSGGTVIYQNKDDYHLLHFPQENQIVGYRRLYADGQATNAWISKDYGSPQEAARALPGLSETLERL